MLVAAAFAAALMAAAPQTPPAAASDPDPVVDAPIALEDVTVTGRTLDVLIGDFVNGVAEPNRNRSLARWSGSVCVGVVNLRGEPAQYLVDRISTVAEDLGLRPGAPGCRPNLLVIATDVPGDVARFLVDEHYNAFRNGASGTDRGMSALRTFQASDRPIRWWQQTMLFDSHTGQRAQRLPGDCSGACTSALEMAPVIAVSGASRLTTQLVNNITRTIVIINPAEVDDLSIVQLADYVAMIALAQIDPDADTSGYNSVLNVVENPGAADGLTTWDTAYLQGLYGHERNRKSVNASTHAIRRAIRDEHGRLRANEDVPSID